MSFALRLLTIGIQPNPSDGLHRHRIILVNILALTILIFSALLIVLALSYQLYPQISVGLFTISLMCVGLWLNEKRNYRWAASVTMQGACLGISVASYVAYSSGLNAETENWLFAFVATCVFFFDRRLLLFHFLLLFAQIVVAKVLKFQILDYPFDRNFVIVLINAAMYCVGLYSFLVVVKRGLMKSYDSLRISNEAKKKLLSIIAHDVKSPLTTFEALLSMGKSGIMTREDFEQHQQMLRERFEPIHETIEGVLEWSRIQSKNMTPVPVSFDPLPDIEKIITIYRGIADEKEIEISLIWSSSRLFMDRDHFKVIMRNLIHNALKFTMENGRVDVLIGEKNDQDFTEIIVEDTGIGMPQTSIDSIMNKEAIHSKKGTRGEQGTGLGLNVSLELLEANECELQIRSKIGKGTRFKMKIPGVEKDGMRTSASGSSL